MLFHYHSGATMVVSFCFSLSYNICVLQSSLLSWLASSALLSCACVQITVPTPSTQGSSPQAPTAVPFLAEILCRMSEVSYQLEFSALRSGIYTPCPEGTEVVGEQVEWERNISLVPLSDEETEVKFFVRGHTASKSQRQELGTSWDWLHSPAFHMLCLFFNVVLFVTQGVRTREAHQPGWGLLNLVWGPLTTWAVQTIHFAPFSSSCVCLGTLK